MRVSAAVSLLSVLAFGVAQAAVDHIEVLSRSVLLEGREFGAAGSFEKIVGRVHFKVRPGDPHNRVIVDLDKAAADANGDVLFSADVFLLRPTAPEKSNGALLLEVPNRGGKALLTLVNGGVPSANPSAARDFGDGWLLRQGYTLAWLGWQWDAPAPPEGVRLYAPIAYDEGGKHIHGLLRDDFSPTEKSFDLPLGHQIVGTIGGTEYEVSDPDDPRNVLTVRDAPTGSRQTIQRTAWSFAHENKDARDDAGRASLVPDSRHVHLNSGFEPGRIYELVYVVQDPVVAGLGLAAVRDFISYLKHDTNDVASVARAYAFGASQSGRFLRHFLYENFNADERGRQVFDGVIAHVAGAGHGSFNHRFAQPSRSAGSMDAFFYPVDLFPFTDLPEREPQTGETAGLLNAALAAGVAPKIFYPLTSYEYWGRAASLIHTSPDGAADARLAENTRIYFFAGLQHFSWPFPPVRGTGDIKGENLTNPNPVRFLLRAMIANMNSWVRDGVEPPPSRHPRIDDGTLVPLARVAFPKIPDVRFPTEFSPAWRLDFGPAWKRGIVETQPPVVGASFPVLLPQVDADGNDLGGVRIPEMLVPLATCTGWNLRDPTIGAPEMRAAFVGSYLPFAATAMARRNSGDPRPALDERYASEADYLARFQRAAAQLNRERWILDEDLPAVLQGAKQEWKAVQDLVGKS